VVPVDDDARVIAALAAPAIARSVAADAMRRRHARQNNLDAMASLEYSREATCRREGNIHAENKDYLPCQLEI
jgi:hypothetical protein